MHSFQITVGLDANGLLCTGGKIDNNCSFVVGMNVEDLTVSVDSVPTANISIRQRSYVSESKTITVLAGSAYLFSGFFANWMENVLEVTLSNSSAQQVFFYRLHKTLPPNEMSVINASFDYPVNFYGWDLMPRYHPQVYNYTLVPKLPSLAYGHTHLFLQGIYVSQCHLFVNPSNMISVYAWRTDISSGGIWMSLKEDFLTFYCNSLAKDYFTKNYTIYYYRESRNTNIASVTAFLNPLQSAVGDFSSNSSVLPLNSQYFYDLRGDNDWTSIGQYPIPSDLRLNASTILSIMSFDPIEFPLSPAGLGLIFVPSDPDAYFIMNLNNAAFEHDYFFSPKSVYPLLPGPNVVYLNITAEDSTFTIYNKYTIPVLSPDCSIETIVFEPVLDYLWLSNSVEINVSSILALLNTSITLNNSNAIFQLYAADQMIASGNNSGNFSISLNGTEASFVFDLLVFAESRNWITNQSIRVNRVDVCGDGRRWAGVEECDDGNSVSGDGCQNCTIESGWVCSGGSLLGPDVCVRSDSGNNSSQQNLSQGNSQTNSSSGPQGENNPDANNATNSSSSSNTDSANNGNSTNQTGAGNNSTVNNTGGTNNTANNNTNSVKNGDKSEEKIFPDRSESYYWMPVFVVITIGIGVGHIITGIKRKKIVFKYGVGGINAGYIPMIWNFQWFFMLATCVHNDEYGFLASFSWSGLEFSTADFLPSKLFLSFRLSFQVLALGFCIIIVHGFLQFIKLQVSCKKVLTFLSFSAYIYLFFLFSPMLLFYAIISVKVQDSWPNFIFSSFLQLFVLISASFLFYLSKKHSNFINEKKVFTRFKGLFEGLRFAVRTVPLASVKSESKQIFALCSCKSPQVKRSSSIDFESEEKPKFYSSPWKKVRKEMGNAEIPEFSLIEPSDDLEILSPPKVASTSIRFNYHLFQIVLYYIRVVVITISIKPWIKLILTLIVFIIQISVLCAKFPFTSMLYNIFHIIGLAIHCILVFSLIMQVTSSFDFDILCVFLALCIILLYFTLAGYELWFCIRKKENRPASTTEARETKVKEFTDGCEKNIEKKFPIIEARLFTEPAVFRGNQPRNCLSFELDNTILDRNVSYYL
jgi:cysteine-rich repeat protein